MNAELLSRIQFGMTIGFHILFPTLNIGLAVFLSIMEGVWLKTHDRKYYKICRLWTKIFALTFGMGVVSGVVLSYELGTNFARFTNAIGPILGPLFNYEVLSAFFLEAGFLGIMLFGWEKVEAKLHYATTLLVTLGTILSAFWIMSANSWMQTPAGYHLSGGVFYASNWWQAIFNPSFIPRFIHMVLASLVTASFVIAGVSAWYLLNHRDQDIAKPSFAFSIVAAAILVPLQIFAGDTVGLKVHQYQPIKTAAMEANWHTQRGAPFIIFAIPDATQVKNLYAITIPKGASLINTHRWNGVLEGITSAPRKNWPLVTPIFFSFRIMLAIGFLFLFIAWYGSWLLWKKQLYKTHWFQKLCVWASPMGFMATIAGWITAEIGRQPWVVYGLMRTQHSVSILPATQVLASLLAFIVIYAVIFGFYLTYLLKLIDKGPQNLQHISTISYIPLINNKEFKRDT